MVTLVAAPQPVVPLWLRPPSLHLRPHHLEALERVHLSMGSAVDMVGPGLRPALKESAQLIVLTMPSACYLSKGRGMFCNGNLPFLYHTCVTRTRNKYVPASLFK